MMVIQIINIEDAVGTVLCHDLTKIVPGEQKGPVFKKGHIITENDIPELLDIGKSHIYIWEIKKGQLHEDQAAERLGRALAGQGLKLSHPSEGKINLIADYDGMLAINENILEKINMIEEMVAATRSNHRPVKKGDIVAGVRVVPLLIEECKLQQVEDLTKGYQPISIKLFRNLKVGVIITGNEVFYGRIQDQFGPVVRKKMESYGSHIFRQIFVPDDLDLIVNAIHTLKSEGAELILTTGGMSVDPDDLTPSAVRKTGAEIITYGAPVLPGSMVMVAYLDEIPVLGLPGCVMYNQTTIFDLLIPPVLVGEKISKTMVARLGIGGLCLNCKICRYPICAFGTGM